MIRRSVSGLLAMAMAMSLSACALWRPTRVPLRVIALPAACAVKPSTLLVFLQGSYSMPEDFESHGFITALRRQHIAADVQLVDAHVGYYSEHSILDRLRADVLEPARAAGYRQVWLVGISIGAYGSVLYSANAPADAPKIAGTIAIAPYLGVRGVSELVRVGGGLATWRPPRGTTTDEYDVALWQWLQQATRISPEPPLYLGYGRDDRFEASDRLLAAALPASHVFTAPGGHDWPAWEDVWQQMLPTLPLPRDASCRAP